MKLLIATLLVLIVLLGLLPIVALSQTIPEPKTQLLFSFVDPEGDYYDPQNYTEFKSTDMIAIRGFYTQWFDVVTQTERESLTFSLTMAEEPQPGDQYLVYIDTDGNSSTGFRVFFTANESGYDQLVVYSEDYVFCCLNGTQYCETDRIFYEDLFSNDLGQVRYSTYTNDVVIEIDVYGFNPAKANYFFETDVNLVDCDTDQTHTYSDSAGFYRTPPGQDETPSPGLIVVLLTVFAAALIAARWKLR